MDNYGRKANEVLRRARNNVAFGKFKMPNSTFSGLQTSSEMREARQLAAEKEAKYAPVKKWPTVQTRKARKAGRKTRKNRKSRKANRR